MISKRPRGTNDILPGQVEAWQSIEEAARRICREYGYEEIRTPIFEHTELFQRSVGDTTDIVEKEMYDFEDKGGRNVTLRPEGTAPVVRAYLEDKLFSQAQPVKLFYIGPMFRYGRPQLGRLRQFHQFGIEVFGSRDPEVDAEVIALAMNYYRDLGLKGLDLRLNSVGCGTCRPESRKAVYSYLKPLSDRLCKTCADRLERNPLRVFDCKEEKCREVIASAPTPFDTLCGDCLEHFEQTKKCLTTLGIPYQEDRNLVRGLDYYTNTAFEILAEDIGAQNSIGGGGRYDGLVEACGGPDIPGIGFGLGLERLLLALESQGVQLPGQNRPDVFVATVEGAAKRRHEETALKILYMLREHGFAADKDYMRRSLKAQMKYADKTGFAFTVIVGGEESNRGCAVVREMKTGDQKEINLDSLAAALKDWRGEE